MFHTLGDIVSRRWPWVLAFWIALTATLFAVAPKFDDVVENGEFAFLPADAPSRLAEQKFLEAFPTDLFASSVVVIVSRPLREEGLIASEEELDTAGDSEEDRLSDYEFISQVLEPRLRTMAQEHGGIASERDADASSDSRPVVSRIRSPFDKGWEFVLFSEDRRAAIVVVELTTEFLADESFEIVEAVEEVKNELLASDKVPLGLNIAISGPATVGRDMTFAQRDSAQETEKWTVILVVLLLIIIYRAPLLALIPLLTVFVAVSCALKLLALLGQWEVVGLFNGIQTYVTVILYGAGVDYCLFLIARYREHLNEGLPASEAIALALGNVGPALAASAGTSMGGIGMMVFAHFGKFQQAGIGISFSLAICLLAALTFTPAMLRAFGRIAFWPHFASETGGQTDWVDSEHPIRRLWERNLLQEGWQKVSHLLLRRPVGIWLGSLLLMTPFAVVGVKYHDYLSYGLISELTEDAVSVQGAREVQKHFPPGFASPVTILLRDDSLDFESIEGIAILEQLSDRIRQAGKELGVEDVRTLAYPTGGDRRLSEMSAGVRRGTLERARPVYVSQVEGLKDHVARIDVILGDDPFSRNSIGQLKQFEEILPGILEDVLPEQVSLADLLAGTDLLSDDEVPAAGKVVALVEPQSIMLGATQIEADTVSKLKTKLEKAAGVATVDVFEDSIDDAEPEPVPIMEITPKAGVFFTRDAAEVEPYSYSLFGATPSIRDLKTTTDGDQLRIDGAVLLSVFLILLVLLRRPAIAVYLIVSVFFSYLVTLGLTFVWFWSLDPSGFAGLDWKVPIFLFTILIAIGEDYNIFLMTRIEEEQKTHGVVHGVTVALEKTGGIISSCGVIMAGTFYSLTAGSLAGMQQLGFALGTGVLLDTFIVRPILVPTWLIILNSGRLGRVGRLLGARTDQTSDSIMASGGATPDDAEA